MTDTMSYVFQIHYTVIHVYSISHQLYMENYCNTLNMTNRFLMFFFLFKLIEIGISGGSLKLDVKICIEIDAINYLKVSCCVV